MGLHNHSEYSNFRLRDSINRIPDLMEYAHKLGHKGIAITEHETIASSLEAQAYLRSKMTQLGRISKWLLAMKFIFVALL